MGLGIRVFFINPNDSFQRIPVARFERFYEPDSEEQFTEFAGQKVRCAFVIVETSNRKPVSVRRIDYMLIQLDRKGKLDTKEHHRHLHLIMTGFGASFPILEKNRSLSKAQGHWANSQIDRDFRWQPSSELEEAIRSAALGK